jgi:hypothetical protein
MNLLEFINSSEKNVWIREPGLKYYVRKWIAHPEIIVLANVYSLEYFQDDTPLVGAYWRFIRRYSSTIPFIVEQVLNYKLALFYERLGWPGYTMSGVPQYASPLAMEKYGYSQYMNPFGSEEKPSDLIIKE